MAPQNSRNTVLGTGNGVVIRPGVVELMTLELTITTQPTPDPNVIKFVTNRTLNPGAPQAYYDAQSALDNPAAADMFAIEGVAGLFIINEFCTVNKAASASWQDLIPQIESTIRAHWGT